MSRYIDADNFERACMSDKNCEDMQDVIYKLRDYPTADVEPVRHGHWIDNGDFVMCSCCTEFYVKRFNHHRNYCPNCGARMDSGKGATE
jgi:NADH pyrophosphatase NudC (nudix superfamily)